MMLAMVNSGSVLMRSQLLRLVGGLPLIGHMGFVIPTAGETPASPVASQIVEQSIDFNFE